MKKIWVVKAGGELMATPDVRSKVLNGLKTLSKKHALVFVHGGGPQIEAALAKNKIPNKFVNGRRVTSPAAITVVEQVLSGEINKGIVGELGAKNVKAVGLSGRDGKTIIGKPIPGLERAAKPQKIDVSLLKALVKSGFVPVVSSVGSDAAGKPVNINADDIASAIGIALKCDNLIFLTNVSGVLDQNKERIPHLKTTRIDALIQQAIITGGMIPKVQSARAAILKGINKITITNGKFGIAVEKGTVISK